MITGKERRKKIGTTNRFNRLTYLTDLTLWIAFGKQMDLALKTNNLKQKRRDKASEYQVDSIWLNLEEVRL